MLCAHFVDLKFMARRGKNVKNPSVLIKQTKIENIILVKKTGNGAMISHYVILYVYQPIIAPM